MLVFCMYFMWQHYDVGDINVVQFDIAKIGLIINLLTQK